MSTMIRRIEKAEVKHWAQRLSADTLILDTETTGLGSKDQVVSICIIDMVGRVMIDRLVKATVPISAEASEVNHITDQMLENEKNIQELWPDIVSVTAGKDVIIYNRAFDLKMIGQSLVAFGMADNLRARSVECAMLKYAQLIGEPGMYGRYKWQKLPGGGHTALSDCLATMALIKKIAGNAI